MTNESFRKGLRQFVSGVTVVTCVGGDTPIGLTVSAFSSLSLDPPLILVCIDKRSSSIQAIESSQAFAVNILSYDQVEISNQFASRKENKFEGVSWHPGAMGMPILDGTLAFLECSLYQSVDGGDHMVFFGEVQHTDALEIGKPLLYYAGQYGTFLP